MKSTITAIATLMVLTNGAGAAVKYCTSDHSIGVASNNGEYTKTEFAEDRLRINVSDDGIDINIGGRSYSLYCHEPDRPDQVLSCSLPRLTFIFDKKTNKYILSRMNGYIGNVTEPLVISYGDCADF